MVKLWAYKAYAVFNSYEQYNNLTYGYHKSRLTFLRFNPLNWGILLLLGSTGAFVLYRRDKQAAIASIALLAGYAVSLVIYYASARFRLPMVPLLAVRSRHANGFRWRPSWRPCRS